MPSSPRSSTGLRRAPSAPAAWMSRPRGPPGGPTSRSGMLALCPRPCSAIRKDRLRCNDQGFDRARL
eukprot:254713-Alexandrium_andersonii.AAC.1